MKTQRMESGSVFAAVAQVIILLMLWGLSVIFDVLTAWVYWLGRFGMCDLAIRLVDKLCERGSAEMNVEKNDVENK